MCFKSKLKPTKPLYRDSKILKIRDLLTLNNCQFVKAYIIGKLPRNFNEYLRKWEISTTITLEEVKKKYYLK